MPHSSPVMQCGIFPDSLFGTLAAAVPPPRSIPEFIQGSTWQRLQPAGSPKVVAVPQLEDDSPVNGDVQRKLTEPSRSTINPKKRSASDNASAAKRRCSSSSHELHTRSAPLTRTSSPVDSNWRSHSTQKAVPRSKMVMDCVELVPLREILRRRKAQPKRADERMQPTPYEDYESWEVTPDTPFVRRTIRELLAGDEIVPETPDVYQRSGQTSPPARRVPDLHEGPLRPPALPQPLTRAATPSSRFTAVMNEVQDVFLQAGVSQLPTHELATSVRLFEAASKNVLRALAKNAGASDAGPTCEQAPVRHGSC
ncbi:hypothetical protein BC834DRAFT_578064 [Gloeopeniophorella convolvens]|nr:hypothetical protein BC834DRAFT_578064 [Gloeopeniophorella convolvens]